jgi:hypothetical protein
MFNSSDTAVFWAGHPFRLKIEWKLRAEIPDSGPAFWTGIAERPFYKAPQ